MSTESRFGRTPLAFANVALILIIYLVLGALAFSSRGRITGQDIGMIWPIHLILAVNLLAIFGPAKPR